jgi:hypothetical protein
VLVQQSNQSHSVDAKPQQREGVVELHSVGAKPQQREGVVELPHHAMQILHRHLL